jgi:cytochrome c peroxidase
MFVRRSPVSELVRPLGERLFIDQRLSHDGTLSCMSCHDVRTNGADRGGQTMAEDPSKLPFRVLTVFNAALNFRLNWEGNYRTLEAQTQSSLENRSRLATSIGEVVGKLNADPAMVRLFKGAYGHGPDEGSLLDAIAVYERSLLTPGGRFDKWIGGDTTPRVTIWKYAQPACATSCGEIQSPPKRQNSWNSGRTRSNGANPLNPSFQSVTPRLRAIR